VDILRGEGYQADIIVDGAVAYQRIVDRMPDVVLLDMHLPTVSGIEVLNRIRSDARLTHVRVIIATADPKMARLAEPKADVVLLKPFGIEDLLNISAHLATGGD
jgi:CheY-like chemotaxis protein